MRSLLKQTPIYPALKRLGHYPDYWWWKLRGEPRRIPHLVKQRTVLEYAKAFRLATLVETGTYYGEMIAAVAHHFRRIYSIEIDPHLAALAQKQFRPFHHIQIIQGDSQTVLPKLLREISEPCLWWLDAGYCGWIGEIGNPRRLTAELSAILGDEIRDHVILMDDADGIIGEDGSPGAEELISSIQRAYPDRQVEIARNILRITPREAKS